MTDQRKKNVDNDSGKWIDIEEWKKNRNEGKDKRIGKWITEQRNRKKGDDD